MIMRKPNSAFVPGAPPLRGNNVQKATSPQLRPNPVSAGKPNQAGDKTQTASKPRANSRAKKVAKAVVDYAPYVAAAFGGGDNSSSSSSSDSFYPEDSRGSFPIYSGRDNPVVLDYEAKTVVDTITDDFLYQEADVERSVKQHLSLAKFFPSTNVWDNLAQDVTKDQFSNVYDRWTTKIQEVRLNTSMYNFWSIENVYKYIHTVTRCLEMYVTLDSILAIDEPVGEVNRVNVVMRDRFNKSVILEAQDRLRRKLRNQWLPVKFRHLILWTYQLYHTAPIRQSMQYRFIPSDTFIAAGTYTDIETELVNLINDKLEILDSQDMTRIRSILRSTLPDGCINSIPAACNRPSYDPKHHEIFANQPIIYTDSGSVLRPFPIYNVNDEFKAYGMSVNPGTNNGFAFALSQSWKLIAGDTYNRDNDFFNSFAHLRGGHYTLQTNQFYAYPTSFNTGQAIWQRNTEIGTSLFDEVGYIHLIEQDYNTGAITTSSTTMPLGYQRVYFNTYNQRLLIVKEVFREMFAA